MKHKFEHIKSRVVELLEQKLPKHLTYHSVLHTLYVLKKTVYIAEKEGTSKDELELLKLAALFHDIGFIESPDNHEARSCKIANEILKEYGYSASDLNLICGMIMATKIPQQPKTHLEKILADADLEYLGTKHFQDVSELLYLELKHFNPSLSRQEWNSIQIDFIGKHEYHTEFCKRYKSHRKKKHLEVLKNNINN